MTKVRWVVEEINGRLKKWKFLDHVVPNSHIPYLGDFVRIVASLLNKYKPPIKTNDDGDDNLARNMRLACASVENPVEKRVSENHGRSKTWNAIDAQDLQVDFPVLSLDHLRNLTFGIYQLKQASRYTDEHLNGGDYHIHLSTAELDILHARIQSRHVASKQYNLWIQYSPTEIQGWYCQCKGGARTVGCCAHVCSVIWFLSYAGQQQYAPKADKYSPSLRNASTIDKTD